MEECNTLKYRFRKKQCSLLFVLSILMSNHSMAIANSVENTSVKKMTTAELKEQKRLAAIQAHKKLVEGLLNNIETIPGLLKSKKISINEVPNPHWNQSKCIACHSEEADKANKTNLKDKNIEASCAYCHLTGDEHNYIHPVDLKPGKEKISTMSRVMKDELKKTSGHVVCSTCHDISLQCKMENRQIHENKNFFRGGPYSKRADLCLKCHQPENYQKFNPHEQVDAKGNVIDHKCTVCHQGDVDDLKRATDLSQVSFHIKENLNAICWGCHKWKPHPGGSFNFFKSGKKPDHLVKPSVEVKRRLQKTLTEKQLLLPLEPETGKVFCATCHNPHAKGVIKNKTAAKGAENKSRLRSKEICNKCHIM